MGQIAPVQPHFRHALVIHRTAGNHRVRPGGGLLQKARNVVGAMLSVRIDLQRVGKPGLGGVTSAGQYGSALAPIDGMAQQCDPSRMGGSKRVQHRSTSRRTAVVNQYAWQMGKHRRRHRNDGVFMVIDRNHCTRTKTCIRHLLHTHIKFRDS